jgi:hypothetical protein
MSGFTPVLHHNPGSVGGAFTKRPRGIALHGSRSDRNEFSTQHEYDVTRRFAQETDLGWNVTIGPDAVAEHIPVTHWGHHARLASDDYLSVELAQPKVHRAIENGQIRAFAWWYLNRVVPVWGEYAIDDEECPTHHQLEIRGLTGHHDGKDDVFPDQRAVSLRKALAAEIARQRTGDEDSVELRILVRHVTGPLADVLQEQADNLRRAATLEMVRQTVDAGIQPVINTIREHGPASPPTPATAELHTLLSHVTGSLANELQRQADALRDAQAMNEVEEIVEAGLQPAINTLRAHRPM